MDIHVPSLETLPLVAQKIIDYSEGEKIWLFYGDMGAGKTTLIRAICDQLNVQDHVSSPTYSLVNEYKTTLDEIIFHFDLYRIEEEQEAYDIGVEDYFFSGHRCLIEWPEKIPSLIPDKYLKISVILENENQRKINLTRQ